MKNLLTALFATTAVSLAASETPGQTALPPPAAPVAQAQSPESGEQAEASRLSRSVIELYKAGRYEEALPLAERALAIREKSSPPGDVAVGTALSNLAAVLVALDKIDRARAAYERAFTILESKLGGDDASTNQLRENLAALHLRKGDHGKAEHLLNLTLTSRERKFGAGHESVARTLVGLAYLYLATRESEKRDAVYSRLIDLAGKTPGKLPEGVRDVLNRYVCTGASHPDARDEMKAIHKRIQNLWEAVREAAPPQPEIPGGVLNGKAVSKPAPAYPLEAKQNRVQGTVVVTITVDETGRVIAAAPMCGPRGLYGASLVAAREARFTPTLKGGRPVKVTGMITYNFVLR